MDEFPACPFGPHFLGGVDPEAVPEGYFRHPDAERMENERIENSKVATLEAKLVCSSHYLAVSLAICPLRFPNR